MDIAAPVCPHILGWIANDASIHQLTEKSEALKHVTTCNTMMEKDSFLGSLLVLPVELWKGIAG